MTLRLCNSWESRIEFYHFYYRFNIVNAIESLPTPQLQSELGGEGLWSICVIPSKQDSTLKGTWGQGMVNRQ